MSAITPRTSTNYFRQKTLSIAVSRGGDLSLQMSNLLFNYDFKLYIVLHFQGALAAWMPTFKFYFLIDILFNYSFFFVHKVL